MNLDDLLVKYVRAAGFQPDMEAQVVAGLKEVILQELAASLGLDPLFAAKLEELEELLSRGQSSEAEKLLEPLLQEPQFAQELLLVTTLTLKNWGTFMYRTASQPQREKMAAAFKELQAGFHLP